MSRHNPVNFTSRLVEGSFESFKTAFSRSILGLLFVKNKRNPVVFQSKRFNQDVVDQVIRFAHSSLQSQVNPNLLKYLKLQTTLDIDWDSGARIKEISNFKIRIYANVAELDLGNITFRQSIPQIQIDFFTSESDAAGPAIEGHLRELVDELGTKAVQITRHNFESRSGKQAAASLGVQRIPAVIINRNQEILENPSKSLLFDRVHGLLSPSIVTSQPNFTKDLSLEMVERALTATY